MGRSQATVSFKHTIPGGLPAAALPTVRPTVGLWCQGSYPRLPESKLPLRPLARAHIIQPKLVVACADKQHVVAALAAAGRCGRCSSRSIRQESQGGVPRLIHKPNLQGRDTYRKMCWEAVILKGEPSGGFSPPPTRLCNFCIFNAANPVHSRVGGEHT